VLGGDLLQSIFNMALRAGDVRLPIPLDGDYPIFQYADDTIIVLLAEDDQLLLFKELLNKYVGFTVLKVNYHKFSLVPINLSPQEAQHVAMVFYCNLGSMPFTYLGLPMGTTNPSLGDFSPIIDIIERRLSANVSFLSYGDSLILVNDVLSSLPTYFMCALWLFHWE
jgi:hypothetical protein